MFKHSSVDPKSERYFCKTNFELIKTKLFHFVKLTFSYFLFFSIFCFAIFRYFIFLTFAVLYLRLSDYLPSALPLVNPIMHVAFSNLTCK